VSPEARAGKTVLVVEDSAMSREKIVSILQELGCSVLTAADGLEGVKQVKEHGAGLSLVVLDIQMPKLDGITALRYMRQIPGLSGLPIVMLTTQVDAETVRSALTHKATDFVRKDASIPVIAERLGRYLEPGQEQQDRDEPPDAELAGAIVRGCRKFRPKESGPYVVCYEAPADLQALAEAKDRGLILFYRSLMRALAKGNARYPGLELGYTIETETKEVTRLLKADPLARMVLASGRRPEGMSLARMARFVRPDGPRVLLMVDSLSALPVEVRSDLAKVGVELAQRGQLSAESLGDLIDDALMPSVRTTATGLRVVHLAEGTGEAPRAGKLVAVRFTGMLQEGQVVFEQITRRDDPYEFVLGAGTVVAGWEEGVALMREGGRALLIVPPELGYGEKGNGDAVPPNATLLYVMELVSVGA
jgi:peptidylprolyl isomerase